MRIRKEYVKHELSDYLAITFGLFLYALGWAAFLLPYSITSGGLTGVSAIIYYVTGLEIQVSYFIINALLLIAAIKILGFKFCVKTIYGVLMLTLLLWLLQFLFRGGSSELPKVLGEGQDFMACLLGAGLCGVGLALTFLHQGSTGGTDIIAAIVNKYKNVTMGRMLLYCDLIIISSCYLIFQDWKRVVFGFVTMFVISYMVDYVMNYVQQSVQFFIISKEYEKIYKAIISDVDRGATLIPGTGCYSGQPVKIIMVIARKNQSVAIFRLVKAIDPKAFVSQTRAEGVYGEGFDKLKS